MGDTKVPENNDNEKSDFHLEAGLPASGGTSKLRDARMIYFLSGNDWFRMREAIQRLRDEFLTRQEGTEDYTFRAEDFPEKLSLVRDLLSGGLFSTPIVIVFRFDEDMSDTIKTELKKILESAVTQKEYLVVVMVSLKVKKSDIFFGWLFQVTKGEILNRLEGLSLETYAEKLLQQIDSNKKIAKDALRQLILNAHGESGLLFYELTKLSLFCEEKVITLADVRELSQEPLQSEVFGALDALVRGNREQATALLRKEEKMNVPVERTLGLMAWQLRRLIEIQELYESGVKTSGAIAKELSMKSDYTVRKVLPRLSFFPLSRLKKGMMLLADLDSALKTGATSPGVGLDLFIWRF